MAWLPNYLSALAWVPSASAILASDDAMLIPPGGLDACLSLLPRIAPMRPVHTWQDGLSASVIFLERSSLVIFLNLWPWLLSLPHYF